MKSQSGDFIGKIKLIFENTNVLLVLIFVGVWTIVIQNTISLAKVKKVNIVEVKNKDGHNPFYKPYALPVEIVNHPDVDVSGTVYVGNTVDVNLESINGYRNCFYNSYQKHPNDYYRIPIANY